MSKRLATIVGARPQFVKAAVLSRILRASSDIDEIIIHTGQHYDKRMSDVFFNQLAIPHPKYNLHIKAETHGRMTGRMLCDIEEIFINESPDAVLVYGDTNTTLAGALAAAKLHIPVIHVEAGLRSFNKRMPEEVNRLLTDHISDLLFCPTNTSMKNLASEGITDNVYLVGDIMYDATLYAQSLCEDLDLNNLDLNIELKNYALVTIHRAENTDNKEQLQSILSFLQSTSRNENLQIILPLHPRTRNAIYKYQLDTQGIYIIDPVGYIEMQWLLSNADLVLTDSGGLQKEAYFHKVPCITLRNETEWIETVEAGWNRLWNNPEVEKPGQRKFISDYGDGTTGHLIYKKILDFLG